MLAALSSFDPRDLLAAAWEMLHGEPPENPRHHRERVPVGQLVLPGLLHLFRSKLDRRPKVADLPTLGWVPNGPHRWVDPETGIDRAEELALIIERERAGIAGEIFTPMSFDDDWSPISKRRPGRPISLHPDQRETLEEVRRREERRQARKRGESLKRPEEVRRCSQRPPTPTESGGDSPLHLVSASDATREAASAHRQVRAKAGDMGQRNGMDIIGSQVKGSADLNGRNS